MYLMCFIKRNIYVSFYLLYMLKPHSMAETEKQQGCRKMEA